MKSLILLIATTLTFSTNSTMHSSIESANNCSAELSVEKNRNYRSASEDGARFRLTLKNTSGTTQTYTISAANSTANCRNSAERNATDASIELSAKIESANSRMAESTITLQNNETYNFTVLVEVPQGTPYYRWGCIDVKAKSNHCDTYPVNTKLNVYIPNPSEG